jgi:hypothetical protein
MIYLGYLDGHELAEEVPGPWIELFALRPGLVLVDSPESRSRVYHALKDQLPAGTPLLVTELGEIPKFNGMRAGALRWCRERLPRRAGP